jgi:hypothetical protein
MKLDKQEKYTIITPTEKSFEDFFNSITSEIGTLKSDHLFINFLESFSVSVEELEQFSEISEEKKENGTTFVLVANNVEIDDFEDEALSVVPTIGEAEDVLEMDDIERDLLS